MIKLNYCSVNNDVISCRDTEIIRDSEKVYSIIVRDEQEFYVFETPLYARVVCSSDTYQTHVWGVNKYDMWLLRKGLNKCIVLSNTHIECSTENICIVSKNRHLSSLSDKLVCILKNIKSLNTRGECVFLLDEDTGITLFFENIVSGRDIEQLLSHVYKLLVDRYGSIDEANIVFNQMKKQLGVL